MLLTTTKRKTYFKTLGLGEYNKENIKKLQKKYLRSKDVDGIYGADTDNLLRHLFNVHSYTKNFAPEEFKCECGGRYCTGYPTYMRKDTLVTLQSIRTKLGVPVTVTSGLRCKGYNNSLQGSVSTSYHIKGKAVDFCSLNTTTKLQRVDLIKWLKPKVKYAYCNGYDTLGSKRSAPNMGNAIHFEVV